MFQDTGANINVTLGGATPDDLVKETTTKTFVKDVIEESKRQPVLVDFWAPWCGPCKQLTPILEKAVKAAKGKVKLVKMNIDEHPAIPGQMGIQSIPAVIAFVNGQPADGFMGALPEGQVVAFLERLTKGKIGGEEKDALAAADAALAKGDATTAASLYANLLAVDGTNVAALAGLSRSYLQTGAIEQAKQTLAMVPEAKKRRRRGRRRARRTRSSRAGGVSRADRRAGTEGRGQPTRPSGALRPRGRAQLEEQAQGRGRPPDRDRAAGPQMERRRRTQATRAVLRGLGPDRRGHRRGTQAAVVGVVCLASRSVS